MFATAISVALFAGIVALLVSMIRANGDKIVAALRGESYASVGPVAINPAEYALVSPRPLRPVLRQAKVAWRAAA